MFLLVAHALAAPAARGLADCQRAYDTGELVDALQSAEGGYAAFDATGFAASREIVHARLACVSEPITAPTIARLHRLEVLSAFLVEDPTRLDGALAALLAVDPAGLPVELVPEGHPIRQRAEAARQRNAAMVNDTLPKLPAGWVEVDGAYVLELPHGRPALLQRFDPDGRVTASWYRWPDEPLGEWGEAPEEPRFSEVAASRVRLLPGVAVGLGVVSAGEPELGAEDAPQAGAFGGSGAHVAARLEVMFSAALGVFGELGYRNLFGTPTDAGEMLPEREEYLTSGDTLHLGYVSAGPSARIGRLTLAAGPVWATGGGTVTGLSDASSEALGYADLEAASYQRFAVNVGMGGGMGRASLDVLRWPTSALALELEGGAATDTDRGFAWASLGLTWAGRPR